MRDRLKSFTAIALEGFPMIHPGDDIVETLMRTMSHSSMQFEDGDIIVISHKVLSKAEGRVVRLRGIVPSTRARQIAKTTGKAERFVELVLSETKRVVKATPEVLLVEDKRGIICINAGIDKSNVEGKDSFAMLPLDPGSSAERCRVKIRELTGKKIGIVVCDTYSRPFRRGQVNFAIGIAGITPFRDYRGKGDLFSQTLKVKNTAVVDEVAAAAELVMGQADEATPVVIIRGLSGIVEENGRHSINELHISEVEDLFKNAL